MPKEKQPGDKGGALFRRRRFWARTSAMQMLYQLDMQKTWEPDSNLLENFDELLATDGLLAEIDAELNPTTATKPGSTPGSWSQASRSITANSMT